MAEKTLNIHSKLKDYTVNIYDDTGFLKDLTSDKNTQYVIDKNVHDLYKGSFTSIPPERLIIIEALEENKVIDTALDICEKMTEISAKRNSRLISIGGGIIQDITGFVANILYRGISWTFVPTTLLAACDSCIGGKTSLNYKKYKNLLGTFYPPDSILICTEFFKTLTQKDFESGLGEVVKFNIMAGADGLSNIENSIEDLLKRDRDTLNKCVLNSLSFKKDFIEVDEFDRGERVKLNFAHTFGHGIETVTGYEIPHGTAVAIGMIMADRISCRRGLLSEETAKRSENVLLKVIHISFDLKSLPFDELIRAIRKDKKQINDRLTAVLLTDTAKDLRLVHDVTLEEIKDALDHFNALYY